jgi:hypothetical protein
MLLLFSFIYTKEEGDDIISKTCTLVVDTIWHHLRLKQDVCHIPLQGRIGTALRHYTPIRSIDVQNPRISLELVIIGSSLI